MGWDWDGKGKDEPTNERMDRKSAIGDGGFWFLFGKSLRQFVRVQKRNEVIQGMKPTIPLLLSPEAEIPTLKAHPTEPTQLTIVLQNQSNNALK